MITRIASDAFVNIDKISTRETAPDVVWWRHAIFSDNRNTTGSNLINLAPQEEFFIGAKLFPGTPWKRKKCENAW